MSVAAWICRETLLSCCAIDLHITWALQSCSSSFPFALRLCRHMLAVLIPPCLEWGVGLWMQMISQVRLRP